MKVGEMKRVTFRASESTVYRLEQMAERYGMSVNALCGYIVGRWLDDNYNLQERVLESMSKRLSSTTEHQIEKMLENPEVKEQLLEFMKWGLKQAAAE